MKQELPQTHLPVSTNDVRDNWFESFVNHVLIDKELLNMDVAPTEKKDFYDNLIFGDGVKSLLNVREMANQYLVKKLFVDYYKELAELKVKPSKLLVDNTGTELLIWAEIEDDDENTERSLLIAEAKANAHNYEYGFHISSIIVEKSDNFPVPPSYQNLLNS